MGLSKEGQWAIQDKASCQRVFQTEGIDYNEIFSLIVKHTSIRLLLTTMTQGNLKLEQLNVKTSFLHGELEERILMKQPEGFIEEGQENIVSSQEVPLWAKIVSQAVVQAVRLIHDQGQLHPMWIW